MKGTGKVKDEGQPVSEQKSPRAGSIGSGVRVVGKGWGKVKVRMRGEG